MRKKVIVALLLTFFTTASFMFNVNSQKVTLKEKTVTFTMLSEDGNPAYDSGFKDPIAKIIKRKTGVTLKYQYTAGDFSQKAGVMLASGKLTDFMFAKGLNQDKFITAKRYISLDSLIEKYGSNIKKLYGKYYDRLKITDPRNKHIYALPCYGVAGKNWWDGGELHIIGGALKEQGFPELTTLSKYENAIKAYVAKHPTFNGEKTIGLTINADGLHIMSSVGNAATGTAGYPDDGNWIIDSKGNAKIALTSEAYHIFLKWLNHMNNIGLLDPEAFIQRTDQYDMKMVSGRVVATIGPSWLFNSALQSLRGRYDDKVLIPVPAMQRDGTKDQYHRPVGFFPGNGIGITTACKDPERAVKFFNYICSEEGQVLTHWGIKGMNYTVVNGKRKLTERELKKNATDIFHSKKTGIGLYNYPFPEYGDGIEDSKGDYITRNSVETISKSYGRTEREVAKGYGVQNFMSFFTPEKDIAESRWGAAWQISFSSNSDLLVAGQRFEDILKSKLPELVLCRPSEYEAKWRQYVKMFRDGGQYQYEKVFSGLVKKRIQLLGN